MRTCGSSPIRTFTMTAGRTSLVCCRGSLDGILICLRAMPIARLGVTTWPAVNRRVPDAGTG